MFWEVAMILALEIIKAQGTSVLITFASHKTIHRWKITLPNLQILYNSSNTSKTHAQANSTEITGFHPRDELIRSLWELVKMDSMLSIATNFVSQISWIPLARSTICHISFDRQLGKKKMIGINRRNCLLWFYLNHGSTTNLKRKTPRTMCNRPNQYEWRFRDQIEILQTTSMKANQCLPKWSLSNKNNSSLCLQLWRITRLMLELQINQTMEYKLSRKVKEDQFSSTIRKLKVKN